MSSTPSSVVPPVDSNTIPPQHSQQSPSRPKSVGRRPNTRVFVHTPEEFDEEEPDVQSFGGRGPNIRRVSWFGSWSSIVGKVLMGDKKGSASSSERPSVFGEEVFEEPIAEEEIRADSGESLSGSVICDVDGEVQVEEEDEEPDERTSLLQNRPHHHHYKPTSDVRHTILNSINLISGMGILALPFAMSLTGWILGISLLILSPLLASTTAKLLAKCMDITPLNLPTNSLTTPQPHKSMTMGDVATAAFGPHAKTFITIVFLMELFAASTALIILTADSIKALFPGYDILMIKCAVAVIVIPTTWPQNIRVLVYASIVGVVAILNLLCIILVDGLTSRDVPGSLINPAPTSWWPNKGIKNIALAVGIIFAGFDGHAVFPTIYRDLRKPAAFPKAINITYTVVTILYLTLAICGYRMFGDSTQPEITQNLPQILSYNPTLTHLTLYLVALNPLTKYALTIRPVNTATENALFSTPSVPLTITTRTLTTLVILLTTLLFPHFHRLMALVGSAFSGMVAVIFPVACYGKLYASGLRGVDWLGVGGGIAVGVVVVGFGTWGALG